VLVLGICNFVACAYGIEESAEGPSSVTIGKQKDAGQAATAPGGGGQAGSPAVTSGAGGNDVPGTGGDVGAGTGGVATADDGGADSAPPSAGGGGAGTGGAGGMTVVEAGPPAAPTGVKIGAQTTPSETRVPSPGGTPYSDQCPTDQVLIGFKGTVDAAGGQTYLRSVQGVCGSLTISGSGTYSVTVAQAGQLTARTSPSAVAQSVNCPSNQVVVGFGGRSGGYIDALDFRCAPLTIGGTSPNFTLSIGNISTTGIIGGATGGSQFPDVDCGNGMVAVGQAPHAGAAIDSFGLICATPSLTIK
jgi:hypothetical protein